MGGALLAGWLEQGAAPSDIVIVDPHFDKAVFAAHDVRVVAATSDIPADFTPEVVLLAVKPQAIDQLLPSYRHFTGALFVSIAAGRTLPSLQAQLGDHASILRAMPNLPVSVRRGVIVLLANDQTTPAQKSLSEALFGAVGEIAWITDEALMDAVTALSGSGPAYVFLMVEAMASAGESIGLAADLAQSLARATVVGAGELLRQSPLTAETLRHNVTSPNGTTFAALQVLAGQPGLTELLQRAVAAAARRSAELAV
jgi:pyrroline-5-carboxylate reductase